MVAIVINDTITYCRQHVIDLWLEERKDLEKTLQGDNRESLNNGPPKSRAKTMENRMEQLE